MTTIDQLRDELSDGISRCSRYLRYHVYRAGPCFDTQTQAEQYKARLDVLGKTWWPQDVPLPPSERQPK